MGLYTLFLWGYFSTYNIWYNSGHNCRYPISQWYSHDIPIHLPRFSMGFYGFPMGRIMTVSVFIDCARIMDLSYPLSLVPRWKDIESSEQNPKIDAIGQLSDWVCLICVLLFDIWYTYIYVYIFIMCIYIYIHVCNWTSTNCGGGGDGSFPELKYPPSHRFVLISRNSCRNYFYAVEFTLSASWFLSLTTVKTRVSCHGQTQVPRSKFG